MPLSYGSELCPGCNARLFEKCAPYCPEMAKRYIALCKEGPDAGYHHQLLDLFRMFAEGDNQTVVEEALRDSKPAIQEALREWETRQIAEALADVRRAAERRLRNHSRAKLRALARARRRSAATAAASDAEGSPAADLDRAASVAVKNPAAGDIWDNLCDVVKGS